MNKIDPLFNHGEILAVHHRVFKQLQSTLHQFTNAEVNKHSAQMVKEWANYVNKKLSEKDALINQLETEKRDLKRDLTIYNNTIEKQRRQIADQQNIMTKTTQRIQTLEKEFNEASITIDNQKKNIATHIQVRTHELVKFERTVADFRLKIIAAEKEQGYWKTEACRITNEYANTMRNYEEKLSHQRNMKDRFYSACLSEMKENEDFKNECEKLEKVQKSQLNEKTNEINRLKTELVKAKSDLEKVNRQVANNENTSTYDKEEYELLLNEKETEIKHYLKIINEKDSQESSQTPCCPVCMSDIDKTKQWIAFYKCGHRTCSECYDDLPLTAQNTKLCPICNTVISISVPLADI